MKIKGYLLWRPSRMCHVFSQAQHLHISKDAVFLAAVEANGPISLEFMVSEEHENDTVQRTFRFVKSGDEMPLHEMSSKYVLIASVHYSSIDKIYHIFEEL